MKILILISLAIALVAGIVEKPKSNTINQSPKKENVADQVEAPIMELVFCLDATGSMSGLIHTAKEKIWDIVTVVSQANPTPEIRLGMVFYRDLNEEFVTKMYPLTVDIDSIYSELLLIQAQGGGDSPESVNQALNESVTKMGWETGQNVYRTIFLVGDCPPHMDYLKDIKYATSCSMANQNNIVINTIKLGLQCPEAIPHFKAIAEATNGKYMQLGQNAADVVITTPYDDSIRYYSNRIDASKLYYGSAIEKKAMETKKENALSLYDKSSSNAVASRAKFNTSTAGNSNFYGKKELIEHLISDKIELDEISEEELPKIIKEIDKSERKAHLEQLKKERAQSVATLTQLTQDREEFISNEMKKSPDSVMFSKEIYDTVKKQAAKSGIKLY